jgi:hypothetical protein
MRGGRLGGGDVQFVAEGMWIKVWKRDNGTGKGIGEKEGRNQYRNANTGLEMNSVGPTSWPRCLRL